MTFKDHEKTENEMAHIHALLLDAYWAINHTLNTRDPDVQETVFKTMNQITNRPRKADGTTVHRARNISLTLD